MKKFRLCVLFLVMAWGVALPQEIPSHYKLVYEQAFDKLTDIGSFEFTQPDKWMLQDEGEKGKSLVFTGKSDYEPPFRSPHTIGLIRGLSVGNFILEADLLQTGKEYGHRDMCIFFGFQNPSQFYYTHIASAMDDNAHQIMLVNSAPRKKISSYTTSGVQWENNRWHRVRIVRNTEEGTIRVYFNGQLIQETSDKTFLSGAIGFGSFDDSGKIDNIRIWSDRVSASEKKYFD